MSEDISEYDAQVKLALEKRSQTYVTALAKASDEITALRAELAETKAALEKARADHQTALRQYVEQKNRCGVYRTLCDEKEAALSAAERRVEELEQTVEIQMAACDRWIVRTHEANVRAEKLEEIADRAIYWIDDADMRASLRAAINLPTGKETPSEPTKPAEISRGGNEECCPHDASDHDHHGCTQYEWDGRPCECECARPSTPTGEETP